MSDKKNQGSISGAKTTVNINKQTSGNASGSKGKFNQGAISGKKGK